MQTDYEVLLSIDEMNNNAPVVFVIHRVTDDTGNFPGVIGGGITLNTVQNFLDILFQKYQTHA